MRVSEKNSLHATKFASGKLALRPFSTSTESCQNVKEAWSLVNEDNDPESQKINPHATAQSNVQAGVLKLLPGKGKYYRSLKLKKKAVILGHEKTVVITHHWPQRCGGQS